MSILKITILNIITIMTLTTISAQTEKSVKDAHGLAVGESAPMFNAIDADSNQFSLEDALKKGVVLIFYRGFWYYLIMYLFLHAVMIYLITYV